MREHERESARDDAFEALLAQSVAELPPEEIVADVTPWRRAMNRILFGMALCAITLNFLCLNYILPAVGTVLLLLGFRTLRRENRWLGGCFAVTVIRAVYFFATLVLNTTILQSAVFTPAVTTALTAVNAVLLLALYFCFWRGLLAVQKKAGLPAQTAAIRQQLLDLGFPEAVLNDLTPEDIAACDGALRVVAVTEDHPFNNGRTVSYKESDGEGGVVSVLDTVYDVKELRLTGVGVQLPGAQETWRVYHHFLWTTDPGFYGTEAIQIRPAYRSIPEGWSAVGDVTGRVLYDRDGQTFTASYHTLGRQTYTADSVFFGQRPNSDLFAAFSMPRHAEHARGYVAYTAAAVQSGYLLNSWCNYTHQQSLLQYPVVTAMEKRMTSAFGNTGAFYTVQHALQFFPEDGQLLR